MRIALASLLLVASCAFAHDAHKHQHGSKPVEGVVSLDVYRDGASIHVLTGEVDGIWYQRVTNDGRSLTVKARVRAPIGTSSSVATSSSISRQSRLSIRFRSLAIAWYQGDG